MFAEFRRWRLRYRTLFCLIPLLFLALASLWPNAGHAQSPTPVIHVPYFAGSANPAKGAIFWFGSVDQSSNFANVRMAYNDEGLAIYMHIFDRRITYDEAANTNSDLLPWDSVSLYLDTQNDSAVPRGDGTYRFDAQLNHWQVRTNYQQAYRWRQGAWQPESTTFITETGYRGYPNDQQDDRGWLLGIVVPFAGLGTPTPPSQGSLWRMALVLHDRDEVLSGPLPDQFWPEGAAASVPESWGHVAFGTPVYNQPTPTDIRTLTLRHGENNVVAPDAAVGGHSECGAQFDPNYFDGWGDANYAGYTQINIQNQWDVADWPCFSRYYVNFPLSSLPGSAQVVSATLTMYMFGNAGYTADEAKPSFIQAARVASDWDEGTLTWNNAPSVLENYSWAVVTPMEASGVKPVTWDVTQAVANAYAERQPLRLSLYSTDGDYSSGKYFWSADAGKEYRPMLKIHFADQAYVLSASPVRSTIAGGGTAQYAIEIRGLKTGEVVTLELGPSSPSGLQVEVTPTTIAAPGGKAIVTLQDRSGADSAEAVFFTVPLKATGGNETQTVQLTVLVNGQQLFLPVTQR